MLELPVSAVNVPTRKVPRIAAYLPKMSKKPKYSLARSLGQSLPNSLRESAWMPPWNMPTRMARNQNSTAERRKNAANRVMPKYAAMAISSMRRVPYLDERRP